MDCFEVATYIHVYASGPLGVNGSLLSTFEHIHMEMVL